MSKKLVERINPQTLTQQLRGITLQEYLTLIESDDGDWQEMYHALATSGPVRERDARTQSDNSLFDLPYCGNLEKKLQNSNTAAELLATYPYWQKRVSQDFAAKQLQKIAGSEESTLYADILQTQPTLNHPKFFLIDNLKISAAHPVNYQSFGISLGDIYHSDDIHLLRRNSIVAGTCSAGMSAHTTVLHTSQGGIVVELEGVGPIGILKGKGEYSFLALRSVATSDDRLMTAKGILYCMSYDNLEQIHEKAGIQNWFSAPADDHERNIAGLPRVKVDSLWLRPIDYMDDFEQAIESIDAFNQSLKTRNNQ